MRKKFTIKLKIKKYLFENKKINYLIMCNQKKKNKIKQNKNNKLKKKLKK